MWLTSSKEEKIHEIVVHKRISKDRSGSCVLTIGGYLRRSQQGQHLLLGLPASKCSLAQPPSLEYFISALESWSKAVWNQTSIVTVISSLSLLQLGLSYNSAHLILLQDHWTPWGGQTQTGSLLSPLSLVFETLHEVPPCLWCKETNSLVH